MTINKEKFEQIALEVANELLRNHPRELQYGINVKTTLDYAHALIKRVEYELSFQFTPRAELLAQSNQLVMLPLVEE